MRIAVWVSSFTPCLNAASVWRRDTAVVSIGSIRWDVASWISYLLPCPFFFCNNVFVSSSSSGILQLSLSSYELWAIATPCGVTRTVAIRASYVFVVFVGACGGMMFASAVSTYDFVGTISGYVSYAVLVTIETSHWFRFE